MLITLALTATSILALTAVLLLLLGRRLRFASRLAGVATDSETSLRMLKAGYEGVYIEQSMGRGIMPLTFSAFKSQRFRWCFGGIQILRRHWRDLMPFGRTKRNRMTRAQRLDYLFGTGLVWFNDVLYLGFTAVLLVTAYITITGQGTFFRPLSGTLGLLPAALLSSGLIRALWSLRQLTGIGVKRSLLALLNWLSLSWTVAIAALQGLVRKRAVFMRTPKTAEAQGFWTALRAAKVETLLGLTLWAGAIASVAKGTPLLVLPRDPGRPPVVEIVPTPAPTPAVTQTPSPTQSPARSPASSPTGSPTRTSPPPSPTGSPS